MRAAKRRTLTDEQRRALKGFVLMLMLKSGQNQTKFVARYKGADGKAYTQQVMSNVIAEAAGAEIAGVILHHENQSWEQVLARFRAGEFDAAIDQHELERKSRVRSGPGVEEAEATLRGARLLAWDSFPWEEISPAVMPEEYNSVRQSFASLNYYGGQEPPVPYLRTMIRHFIDEGRGKVHREIVHGDPNAPDPEVAHERERRRALRKGGGKGA
jgi:hypothetical protein